MLSLLILFLLLIAFFSGARRGFALQSYSQSDMCCHLLLPSIFTNH